MNIVRLKFTSWKEEGSLFFFFLIFNGLLPRPRRPIGRRLRPDIDAARRALRSEFDRRSLMDNSRRRWICERNRRWLFNRCVFSLYRSYWFCKINLRIKLFTTPFLCLHLSLNLCTYLLSFKCTCTTCKRISSYFWFIFKYLCKFRFSWNVCDAIQTHKQPQSNYGR